VSLVRVSTLLALLRAVGGGLWRHHPGRLVLAVTGIGFGVALGVAVHLINASAAIELDRAVRSLAGEAHLTIQGPRSGFPDTLYAEVMRLPEVAAASPALEIDAQIAGERDTLRVLGLDLFRAAAVQPQLLGAPREILLRLLEADHVILSRSAADDLGLKTHDSLRLHAGSGFVEFNVIDVLPQGATGQRLALIDIAHAQWRFARLGELTRIDLVLTSGSDHRRVEQALESLLPPGLIVATPQAEAARTAALSRAYRVNLDMLALVALFTGGFLVFTTQFLAVLRRRRELALLRTIGLTRNQLFTLLVAEGALIGTAGSAAGCGLGYLMAHHGVRRLGVDLGAGYFRAVEPVLHVPWGTLAVFLALGIGFSILGAALPALEAARRPPALALRAGDEESALRHLRSPWPGVMAIVAGLVLAQAPPAAGLPLPGYISIALILIGAILAMPRFAEAVLSCLSSPHRPTAALACAQLKATPRQVGVSLAAILASFSLMVSMLIMIGSFRTSLEVWLDRILPAHMYVRAGRMGTSGFFTPAEQAHIAALPGISSVSYARSQNLLLRADRPPIALLAWPVDAEAAQALLPLQGRAIVPGAHEPPPVWISEIAAELLNLRVGAKVELPVGNAARVFTVAGVWRDYARQNGAIVMERALYVALTGDERANDAAIHLTDVSAFDAVAERVRATVGDPEALEIAPTYEIKAASLAQFDRTFAVTYALQIAAVVIGLFGVSASFSAQTLARRREFGVLRHLGMQRRQIAGMIAIEGALVGGLGVAAGLAVGWVLSLILIHVVNRQSFYWSMDVHVPWSMLALLAGLLIAAASATAVLSGRRAMSDEVVRAVREDW
jgi:putative ABC transport system permease protein